MIQNVESIIGKVQISIIFLLLYCVHDLFGVTHVCRLENNLERTGLFSQLEIQRSSKDLQTCVLRAYT